MSAIISMKMSASWEAEKSSSNAVPRLCTLSLAQIILDRPIEPDSTNTNFFVVVRMRGSARRVLRSPEITLVTSKSVVGPVNGATNSSGLGVVTEGTILPAATSVGACSMGSGGCVPIDVNCSIQYSHWLNRDANILQILLQRRKKYKSKTVNLGYKTLAYCNVNLSHVLQRRIENRFLELYTDPNCSSLPVGRVEVQCLSTAPLEKDLLNGKRKVLDEDEEYALPDVYSEDSDHVEESDEDQIAEIEESGHSRQKKLVKAMSVGQKQIKQKLIGLLRKLKIGDPTEEDLDPTETCKLWDEIDLMTTVSDIEEEDSEADGTDTISIQSTPKPILRPFFATTGGSDDTLGADAGTKLLRRLHRQLVASGEAEVPDESGLRGVFPSIGTSRNSVASKKVVPITTSSFLLTTISRGGTPSGIRHRRGVSLTGGRLAKRFAHMGRRSNPAGSGKHHPIGIDAPKSLESLMVPSSAFDASDSGVVGKSVSPTKHPGAENLSEHDSSDEGSPSNERPTRLSRSSYQDKADILSTSLDGDSLAVGRTQSTIAAAYGRQQQAMLRISPTSPTLTSTPDLNRVRDSLSRRSQAQESLFSQCTLQHEIDKLPPGSIDKLKQVVFLVNSLEPGGKLAIDLLGGRDLRIVTITSYAETKQLFARLVTDVQSQNRRASIDDVVKVCILGGNALVSFVLRAYVDQLSSRSAELAAAFRFFVIPVSGLTKSKQSSCVLSYDSQRAQHHQVQQQQLQQQRTPVKTGRSRPVSEVPSSYLDAWTDVDCRFAVSLDGSGSLYSENNLLACQLCKLDPKYALLFSDLCVEFVMNDASVVLPTMVSAQTPAQSNSTEEQPADLHFFDRCLVYLSSSWNIVSIPIGACLLGLASSVTTQPVSRPHKQSQCAEFVGNYPPGLASAPLECNQNIPTDNLPNVTGNLSKSGASSGSAGLNEELLMPFLLTVRLGSIPNHNLPTQALTRSGTGDPVMPSTSGSAVHNTSDLGSVLSDPEASSGSAKRSLSPEFRSQTAVASPNSSFRRKRFHRAYSTFHSTTSPGLVMLANSSFWDLQLEYWVVQMCTGSSSNSANTTATATQLQTPASTSALPSLATAPILHGTATSDSFPAPRRVTLKSTCPCLVVTLGSVSTGGRLSSSMRGGDLNNPELLPHGTRSGIGVQPQLLTLAIWTKEKKQKIMRIGRRGKDCGCKFDLIEGIQRLLCTGRGCVSGTSSSSVERSRDFEGPVTSHGMSDVGGLALESASKNIGSTAGVGLSLASSTNQMMRVFIDGVEWNGLKFFQISSTWRTHIKSFPICSMSVGRLDQPHHVESTGTGPV